MYVHREYAVVVRAMHDSGKQHLLTQGLPATETRLIDLLLSKKVDIDLTGSLADFDIQYEYKARTQAITTSKTGPTEWRWKVSPKQPGDKKTLKLIVTNVLRTDMQEAERTQPYNPKQTIEVCVLVHPLDEKRYQQYFYYGIPTVGGLSIIFVVSVRIRRRKNPIPQRTALKKPSSGQLRRLLETLLLTDSELEAFCLDEYPEVYKQFTNGMYRIAKLNLLLSHADHMELLNKIIARYPDKCSQNPSILHFFRS